MFNLSNETDYKLLSKTKNYYNFFILTVLFLFTAIFIRLIFLSIENNDNFQVNKNKTSASFQALPTIYDLNRNIRANL